MANSLIYKDIVFQPEATYGVSVAGSPDKLHVRTVTLSQTTEKILVEDTVANVKGRDRIVLNKNTVEGDVTGYVTPRGIHHALELALGTAATVGSSVGLSATLWQYDQNTTGTLLSKTMILDRNNSQEAFRGVRGKSLEITSSDSVTEYSLGVMAQSRTGAAALADLVGETVKPFVFADWTVQVNAGTTIGTAPITLAVSEWNIKYDNGQEGAFLSGSANLTRSDPMIPTLEGKIKIFHAGNSWADASFGNSNFYMRLQGTMPSGNGLVAGVTPYTLKIDMPKTQLSVNVRNYEQAAISVEDIDFVAQFETGLSYMIRAEMTAGQSIS